MNHSTQAQHVPVYCDTPVDANETAWRASLDGSRTVLHLLIALLQTAVISGVAIYSVS